MKRKPKASDVHLCNWCGRDVVGGARLCSACRGDFVRADETCDRRSLNTTRAAHMLLAEFSELDDRDGWPFPDDDDIE